MTKKKVLIVSFYNNGDIRNEAYREAMHHKIVKQLENEGKEVYNTSKMLEVTTTTFQDGSTVTSSGFGGYLQGRTYAEIYIDERLEKAGIDMSKVLTKGNFTFNVNSKFFTFNIENDKIDVKSLPMK